jgi:hypothetical protein
MSLCSPFLTPVSGCRRRRHRDDRRSSHARASFITQASRRVNGGRVRSMLAAPPASRWYIKAASMRGTTTCLAAARRQAAPRRPLRHCHGAAGGDLRVPAQPSGMLRRLISGPMHHDASRPWTVLEVLNEHCRDAKDEGVPMVSHRRKIQIGQVMGLGGHEHLHIGRKPQSHTVGKGRSGRSAKGPTRTSR